MFADDGEDLIPMHEQLEKDISSIDILKQGYAMITQILYLTINRRRWVIGILRPKDKSCEMSKELKIDRRTKVEWIAFSKLNSNLTNKSIL